MVLSHTARPGKPPKPPRVITGPWSVHSQPLSEGDVSLCFKILHHGGLQLQGDPAACSALHRNCWGFLSPPNFPVLGKIRPRCSACCAVPCGLLQFPAGANTIRTQVLDPAMLVGVLPV